MDGVPELESVACAQSKRNTDSGGVAASGSGLTSNARHGDELETAALGGTPQFLPNQLHAGGEHTRALLVPVPFLPAPAQLLLGFVTVLALAWVTTACNFVSGKFGACWGSGLHPGGRGAVGRVVCQQQCHGTAIVAARHHRLPVSGRQRGDGELCHLCGTARGLSPRLHVEKSSWW